MVEKERIEIYSWKSGLQKISLTTLIREKSGLGLKEAKALVDGLLDEKPFVIEIPPDESEAFMEKVSKIGAICRRLN